MKYTYVYTELGEKISKEHGIDRKAGERAMLGFEPVEESPEVAQAWKEKGYIEEAGPDMTFLNMVQELGKAGSPLTLWFGDLMLYEKAYGVTDDEIRLAYDELLNGENYPNEKTIRADKNTSYKITKLEHIHPARRNGYGYNVQTIRDGRYVGQGRFCKTYKDAQNYVNDKISGKTQIRTMERGR